MNMASASSLHQVIDVDEKQPTEIKSSAQLYFGNYDLYIGSDNELKITFKFRHDLTSSQLEGEEELIPIERNQYQLSRIELSITDKELTKALKEAFGDVRTLAVFLRKEMGNPSAIQIDQQKLTLKNSGKKVFLYYSNFRKYDTGQLLKQLQRFQETINSSNQASFNAIDQQLIESVLGQDDLLGMCLDESEEESSSLDSSSQDRSSQNQNSTGSFNQNMDRQSSIVREGQANINEYQEVQQPVIFKQNQVPIYERFRNVNINCSRKQKIKLAEQMLRIGYLKEDIIKFFTGGAEAMEQEAKRMPDYRNPESARYKQIHLIVAKKQHIRHNELLRRHGLPPVAELPEYSGQVVQTARLEADIQKTIRQLLIKYIKEKRFKRLDEIQLQMRRNGVDATLPYLKKLVEELKQKSQERKMLAKHKEINQPELSNE